MDEFMGYKCPKGIEKVCDNSDFVDNSTKFCVNVNCTGIFCNRCLLSAEDGYARQAREKYRNRYTSPMPELKPGMIMRYGSNSFKLLVNAETVSGYGLELTDTGLLELDNYVQIQLYKVTHIYYGPQGSDGLISASSIVDLLRNADLHGKHFCIWSLDTTRRMTVAEIEKELGYKIKIVADAQCEDRNPESRYKQ